MKSIVLSVFLVGVVSCVSVINPWNSESIRNEFKRKIFVDSLKSQLQKHSIKRLVDQSNKQKQTKSLKKMLTNYRRDYVSADQEPSDNQEPSIHCFAGFYCPKTKMASIMPQLGPNDTIQFPDGFIDNVCTYTLELFNCYGSGHYQLCDEVNEILKTITQVANYICGEGKAATQALIDCANDVSVQNKAKALFETMESVDEDTLNLNFLGEADNICCTASLAKGAVGSFARKQCEDQSAAIAAETLVDFALKSSMLVAEIDYCFE